MIFFLSFILDIQHQNKEKLSISEFSLHPMPLLKDRATYALKKFCYLHMNKHVPCNPGLFLNSKVSQKFKKITGLWLWCLFGALLILRAFNYSKIKSLSKYKTAPWDRWAVPGKSSQSYDFTCSVPYRSLLNTVIPGWLWRGMTEEGGMQNIPICSKVQRSPKVYYQQDSGFGELSNHNTKIQGRLEITKFITKNQIATEVLKECTSLRENLPIQLINR